MTVALDELIEKPRTVAKAPDLLSDVLSRVRLSGALFLFARIGNLEVLHRLDHKIRAFRKADRPKTGGRFRRQNAGRIGEELMEAAVAHFRLTPVRGKEILLRLAQLRELMQKKLGRSVDAHQVPDGIDDAPVDLSRAGHRAV